MRPERGTLLYRSQRPPMRSILLFFILATFIFSACGSRLTNANWPGLTTDGENVYIAYGSGVLAFNVPDEEELWLFPAEENRTLNYFAAPSVQDGRIVVGDFGATGGFFSPSVTVSIYALEEREGKICQLWTNSAVASDKIVAPPLQAGGQLFVGTADDHILSMDADNGTLNWDVLTGHGIWGQAAYQNDKVIVASMDRSVYALNAANGNEIWKTSFEGALPSKPVIDGSTVYIAGFDSQVHALDIETGQEKWSAAATDWIWGAPVVADGTVFFADVQGNLFAVNAANGEMLWQQQLTGSIQTSPVVVDGTVYIVSEADVISDDIVQGALTAVSVENGLELWQKTTPVTSFTTPVIVDDVVIVALQTETALLVAFDRETGGQRWTVAPPVRPETVTPIVDCG